MKINLYLALLVVCFVGVMFIGCGKKGDAKPADSSTSIVGTWNFAKDTLVQYKLDGSIGSIQPSGPDDRIFVTYKTDGTYIEEQDLTTPGTSSGTYTLTGNVLVMKGAGDDGSFIATVKTLNDHNLVIYTDETSSKGYRVTYVEYFTR